MSTLQLYLKTECELRNSGNPERILGSRFVLGGRGGGVFRGGKKIESLFKPEDSKAPPPPPQKKKQKEGEIKITLPKEQQKTTAHTFLRKPP